MRGADRQTAAMFSYRSPETLVPENHPLRTIRPLVNAALERLSGDFDEIYSAFGRDSIAPEKLLRALLLQAFFSVRSERQLMEQLTYNMMFRWFVGLSMDAPVWDVTARWCTEAGGLAGHHGDTVEACRSSSTPPVATASRERVTVSATGRPMRRD